MASDLVERLRERARRSGPLNLCALLTEAADLIASLEQQVEDLRTGSASSETRLDAPSAPSAGAELPDPDEGHDLDATCLQVRS